MSNDLKSERAYIKDQLIMRESSVIGVTDNKNEVTNMVSASEVIQSTIATRSFVAGNLIIPTISAETILELGGIINVPGVEGQMMLNGNPTDNNLYIYKNNSWKKVQLTNA